MSGGHFDYSQYHISYIVDEIEGVLERQGKEKPKDELYMCRDYYEKYPEEMYYPTYPAEVQEKMREAVKQLRIAAVYAQRIDWMLSGDDSMESFLRCLEEELTDLQSQTHTN